LLPQATNRWSTVAAVEERRGHLDACRVLQELVGQLLDFRRHGGREEQRLPGERDELDDPLDVGNEAHVEHPVGFVDDQKFDAGHQQLAAFRVVEQAAGRGDQHVGAALKLAILFVKGNAADQQNDVETVVLAVFLEILVHLGRQFAGRLEDQRARHARPGAASFEHCQHRQDEGCGLSGSGLGDAQYVLAFQRGRDGLGLDHCCPTTKQTRCAVRPDSSGGRCRVARGKRS
jgi:hypothetical protein